MAFPLSSMAQELYLTGGILRDAVTRHSTYAYNLEYLEGLGENFAISYTYLNQGHFDHHHRDGAAVDLWLRTSLLDRRLTLSAGAGPFYYLDTTYPRDGSASADEHGWGGIASLAATWYTESNWLFRLRGNWVKAGGSFDTLALLAGIGYRFDEIPAPGMARRPLRQTEKTTNNELTLFGGQTTVNQPGNSHSRSTALEYRRGLWRFVDWTAGFLYEGESGLIHRYGITSQLWLNRAVLKERLALGLGAGGYLAMDHSPGHDGTRVEVPVIFTMTGSYRINPTWLVRASWNRVITGYDRDSDVFLGGLGYRF